MNLDEGPIQLFAVSIALMLLLGTVYGIGGFSGRTDIAIFNAFVAAVLTFATSLGWINETMTT